MIYFNLLTNEYVSLDPEEFDKKFIADINDYKEKIKTEPLLQTYENKDIIITIKDTYEYIDILNFVKLCLFYKCIIDNPFVPDESAPAYYSSDGKYGPFYRWTSGYIQTHFSQSKEYCWLTHNIIEYIKIHRSSINVRYLQEDFIRYPQSVRFNYNNSMVISI